MKLGVKPIRLFLVSAGTGKQKRLALVLGHPNFM
jgi:hypothetical protein